MNNAFRHLLIIGGICIGELWTRKNDRSSNISNSHAHIPMEDICVLFANNLKGIRIGTESTAFTGELAIYGESKKCNLLLRIDSIGMLTENIITSFSQQPGVPIKNCFAGSRSGSNALWSIE